MGYSTLQKLAAICAISATVPAASALVAAVDAAHVFGLIGRDTICSNSNLTSCPTSYPSGWCCPQSTVCTGLNNTGTVAALCCPVGSDCSQIEPISCNITLQDASKFPSASVHVEDLTVTLPTCGNNCCPLGYSCNSAGNCQILNSTKEAQTSSASTSSATTSVTASSSTSSKSTATIAPANVVPTPVSNSFSGTSFAAGFIPGVILGILGTAALIFFLTRRKKRVDKGSIFNEKPDRTISDPIYHPQLTARTDFLHKRTASEPPPQSATLVATPPETYGGYYNPNIKHPAKPSPTATTDSLAASLAPPFDTPTPMPKRLTKGVMDRDSPSTPPMRVRGLFSTKSPSLRRKKSQHSLGRNASDKRSDVSEATIDVRMSHGTPGFGLPPQGAAQGRNLYPPAVTRSRNAASPAAGDRNTTYSDVLRAMGVDGTPAKLGSPWRGK